MMDWKEELNKATNNWSCTRPGKSGDDARESVKQVVRDINEHLGCRLIEPTQEHMERVNQSIGDVEPSMSLEELVAVWNDLANEDPPKANVKRERTKTMDDIYPLTIVKRRFGGYAIVNGESFFACVDHLQGDEEWCYGDSTRINMERDWPYIRYGIGETTEEALEDYWRNDIKVTKWEEADRDRVLTEYVERLAKKVSGMMPSIGLDKVDIEPMKGPTGVLFHLDSIYNKKKDDIS